MSKIIKQYADQVSGIEIYPMVSLMIFTVFFAAMLFYVRKMSQDSVDEMSKLPLEMQDNNDKNNA
jgi:hypothetical protein